ncbi:glutathione S-transferase, partial [Pseudomonas syringae pv. actinidiae]|nr:glutathione S-transferase [Pseudomonas syringae pv. actinidiae]
ELSGADIQMSFIGEFAKMQGMLQPYPNLAAWVQRCQERPAYRQALEQGGEYSFAK